MRQVRRGAGFALAALAFELLLRWLGYGGDAVDARSGAIGPHEVTIRNRSGEGWADSRWKPGGVRLVPGSPHVSGPAVVVLGDSFTQALQVGDGQVYTALVQHALDVPVANRGCAACSPADYAAEAEPLLAHNPAWTVIQLNARDLYGDAFDVTRTHFRARDGGLELVEVGQPLRETPLHDARETSALVDYALARAGSFRRASKMPPLFRASEASDAPADAGFRVPPFPHVEPVLDEMSRAWYGRVTFLFIPDYLEDRETSWPYVDERPRDVERRFERWCRQTGASCVNLRASFDDFARRGRAPAGFPNSEFGRGHLNREGHRAAAELLTRELQKVRGRGLF